MAVLLTGRMSCNCNGNPADLKSMLSAPVKYLRSSITIGRLSTRKRPGLALVNAISWFVLPLTCVVLVLNRTIRPDSLNSWSQSCQEIAADISLFTTITTRTTSPVRTSLLLIDVLIPGTVLACTRQNTSIPQTIINRTTATFRLFNIRDLKVFLLCLRLSTPKYS